MKIALTAAVAATAMQMLSSAETSFDPPTGVGITHLHYEPRISKAA
jgi:hypothetical protein